MVCTGTSIEMYVDGVKSTASPALTNAPVDLMGKATLGSHYSGSDFADVTMGEAVLFSKALTGAEVSGLSAYLRGKWVK